MVFVKIVMNKLVIILLLGLFSFVNAQVNIIVSILPQKTFVKAIGKDMVHVTVMVKPGNSPHNYEPKPSQMKAITKANIYFSIGVEFENSWLDKFANQNHNMQIKNISQGIARIKIQHHFEAEDDPHIWTSPSNVKIIAKNIYTNLVHIDKKNKNFYKKNLDKFIEQIEITDKQIKRNLQNIPKGSKFMVFHPAWGYFASEYNLTQLCIEIDGKSPKPKSLMNLIKKARDEKVRAIFVQPEFSPKAAKIIANELNIDVIKISPLDPKWSKNLLRLSKAIAKK